MSKLAFKAVDRASWSDLEQLFESRGGPKSCWCMAWRARGAEAKQRTGAERKAALRKRVDGGAPIGLVGYVADRPVAWCSIAPRSTYRRLSDCVAPGEDESRVWSLACFFIRREWRGQNLSREIIDAAVTHARANGATVVEAYPVDPDSLSYRFMGYAPTFAAAGFHEIGLAGVRRHVMRLELG